MLGPLPAPPDRQRTWHLGQFPSQSWGDGGEAAAEQSAVSEGSIPRRYAHHGQQDRLRDGPSEEARPERVLVENAVRSVIVVPEI